MVLRPARGRSQCAVPHVHQIEQSVFGDEQASEAPPGLLEVTVRGAWELAYNEVSAGITVFHEGIEVAAGMEPTWGAARSGVVESRRSSQPSHQTGTLAETARVGTASAQ